jgi:hypothetical protein
MYAPTQSTDVEDGLIAVESSPRTTKVRGATIVLGAVVGLMALSYTIMKPVSENVSVNTNGITAKNYYVDSAYDSAAGFGSWLSAKVYGASETVTETVSDTGKDIVAKGESAKKYVGTLASNATAAADGIRDMVHAHVKDGKGMLSGVVSNAKQSTKDAKQQAMDLYNNMTDGVSELTDKKREQLHQLSQNLFDMAQSKQESVEQSKSLKEMAGLFDSLASGDKKQDAVSDIEHLMG